MQKETLKRDVKKLLRIALPSIVIICSTFIVAILWILSEEFGFPFDIVKSFIYFNLAVVFISILSSFFVPLKFNRVIPTFFIVGFSFSYFSLLGFVWSLAFVASIKDTNIKIYVFLATTALLMLWCFFSLRLFKKKLVATRFVENEFKIRENGIFLRVPQLTDLDKPTGGEKTLTGWFNKTVVPKLFFLIPVAYPLQRLLTDSGGIRSGLLLISIISFPLTVYLIGRLSNAFYLWIYIPWKMEHKFGKTVVFDD